MTPEKLELHKRLQEFYKEKMGEWQNGDRYIQDGYNTVDFYCTDCQYDSSEELQFHQMVASGKILCIPLPIDPDNPERGLSEMLEAKGKSYLTKNYGLLSFLIDPETALLKALCEQEGK